MPRADACRSSGPAIHRAVSAEDSTQLWWSSHQRHASVEQAAGHDVFWKWT